MLLIRMTNFEMRERTECETVGVPMKGVVLYVYTLYDVEEKN